MKCGRAGRHIPLLAGGDLSPRKTARLIKHIEACPSCLRELEDIRAARDRIKISAREAPVEDWSDGEWKSLMARITSQRPDRRPLGIGRSLRWLPASGLAAVLVLTALIILSKSGLLRKEETTPATAYELVQKEKPALSTDRVPVPENTEPPSQQETPPVNPSKAVLARKATVLPEIETVPSVPLSHSQEVVTVTYVSQETGLQIVWFLDKNFEWKGDQQ